MKTYSIKANYVSTIHATLTGEDESEVKTKLISKLKDTSILININDISELQNLEISQVTK